MLEVGSGLGYWAYLLKLRSGDESRVRCFDPYAPPARRGRTSGKVASPTTSGTEEDSGALSDWYCGGTCHDGLIPRVVNAQEWVSLVVGHFSPRRSTLPCLGPPWARSGVCGGQSFVGGVRACGVKFDHLLVGIHLWGGGSQMMSKLASVRHYESFNTLHGGTKQTEAGAHLLSRCYT